MITTHKQYLWPEAVWTRANKHIISHVSKCIIAKISCDIRPEDAAQARTAGTIKGGR